MDNKTKGNSYTDHLDNKGKNRAVDNTSNRGNTRDCSDTKSQYNGLGLSLPDGSGSQFHSLSPAGNRPDNTGNRERAVGFGLSDDPDRFGF